MSADTGGTVVVVDATVGGDGEAAFDVVVFVVVDADEVVLAQPTTPDAIITTRPTNAAAGMPVTRADRPGWRRFGWRRCTSQTVVAPGWASSSDQRPR